MGLLIPGNGSFIDSRLETLDRELRSGKPEVGWRGDERLELRFGIISNRQQKEVARRLEVWRDCSDMPDARPTDRWGTWRIIGHWKPSEAERILADLVAMDPRSRGHIKLEEQLEKAAERQEKLTEDIYREHVGSMYEHALALLRDRETRHFFGQAGMGDGKMTRQRKRAEQRKASA